MSQSFKIDDLDCIIWLLRFFGNVSMHDAKTIHPIGVIFMSHR